MTPESDEMVLTVNLDLIRQQISEAHSACESHLQEGLEKANRVGELLIAAKEAVHTGQ